MPPPHEDPQALHPHLYGFLQRRLPELGLDVDTYGPYVWGGADDDEGGVGMEGGGDGNPEEGGGAPPLDREELEQVVELLQASSETHSDADGAVWEELTDAIMEHFRLDREERLQSQSEAARARRAQMDADLARAKKEQEEAMLLHEKKAATGRENTKQHTLDEAAKRDLLLRYGYDEPAEDELGGGPDEGGGAGTAPSVVTNREAAAAAQLEKTKELRSKKIQTKKEQQQQTKEQKNQKELLKEERRKRTQKGERKGRG
jgi:hypothetical protein